MTERFGKKQSELQRWYLREWRKYRGMTQEQLAEAIDSAKPTISRMENGQIPYNQPFLEACAAVLECAPADLLASPPNDLTQARQIMDKVKHFPPDRLNQLFAIIEVLEK